MTKQKILIFIIVGIFVGLGSFGLARDYAQDKQKITLEEEKKVEQVEENKQEEIATTTQDELIKEKEVEKKQPEAKQEVKTEEPKTEPAKTSETSKKTEKEDAPKKLVLNMTELAKHNNASSCWLLLSGKIYDVTDFVASHPGGSAILQGCGKDATTLFETRPMGSGTPHSSRARAMQPEWYIGDLVK